MKIKSTNRKIPISWRNCIFYNYIPSLLLRDKETKIYYLQCFQTPNNNTFYIPDKDTP